MAEMALAWGLTAATGPARALIAGNNFGKLQWPHRPSAHMQV
jgi:hypothetical protein